MMVNNKGVLCTSSRTSSNNASSPAMNHHHHHLKKLHLPVCIAILLLVGRWTSPLHPVHAYLQQPTPTSHQRCVLRSQCTTMSTTSSLFFHRRHPTMTSHHRHVVQQPSRSMSTSYLQAQDDDGDNKTTDKSNDDVDDNEDKKLIRKVADRKQRVLVGYRLITIQYLLTTLLFTLGRGGVKQRIRSPTFIAYWTSGPLVVAGIAYILQNAVLHDRLSSDTYKRLNLSLLGYSMLSLVMAGLAPEIFKGPLFIIPPFITFINSIKGYGYGVLGLDKQSGKLSVFTDFITGCQTTIKNLFSLPITSTSSTTILNSIGYLAATWFVGILTVGKIWEILQLVLSSTAATTGVTTTIATRISRLARLSLLTSILYTLKDAADRNRLMGTTFVQLNILSSWVFTTMSAYLGWNTQWGLVAGFFAIFTGGNGIISFWQKQQKA